MAPDVMNRKEWIGGMRCLAEDFVLPNGLAFSPDESVLYIDDSDRKHIRAFDVRADGGLSNGRVLLDMASSDPGVPDGLKVDLQGNVFSTGPGGVVPAHLVVNAISLAQTVLAGVFAQALAPAQALEASVAWNKLLIVQLNVFLLGYLPPAPR